MLRPSELKPIEVVVLVLENDRGDILLSQRHPDKHLGGYWEFPGGKIEANETPEQALYREINEELNFTPSGALPILSIDHQYESTLVHLRVFHLHCPNPDVRSNENQPLQWTSPQNLPLIKLPEANQAIVKHLLSKTQ